MTHHNLKLIPLLFILVSACGKPEAESSDATESPVATESVIENDVNSPAIEVAPAASTSVPPETDTTNIEVDLPVSPDSPAGPAENKPYQLVDGKISENVMEGWRTYNGGGCGTCHGKGGIGAVGPNLAESLKSKISEDTFYKLVENGVPGTMMRPNNTNKRVMDNLDNLYAYLLARSDGVLGPENLIKFPLGKSE